MVTALGVGAAFFPGATLVGQYVPWCLAALVAATVFALGPCLFVRMEGRAPVVAAALSYLAFVVLLVQAQGGTVRSGSFQLALLPVLWVSADVPRIARWSSSQRAPWSWFQSWDIKQATSWHGRPGSGSL